MGFFQSIFGKRKGVDFKERNFEPDIKLTDTKSLLERTKRKIKLRNYNEALEDINSVLELEPNNAEAYMERSTIKSKLKDNVGAKNDLEYAGILIKKFSNGIKSYEKGINFYNDGDYKNAIKFLSEALSSGVVTSDAYYYRGIAKKYNNDFRGAVLDFDMSIKINPTYTEAYYQRGKIKYHKLNETKGALDDFDYAIQLKKNDADIYITRAILKNSTNDITGAMNDYNKAIELDPQNGQTYFSRAMLKFAKEDYSGVINDLTITIKMGLPNDASISIFDAYSLRGGMNLILKNYQEAIKDFDKGIELNPADGKIYFERGEARRFLKQYELAAMDRIKATQLGYEEEN